MSGIRGFVSRLFDPTQIIRAGSSSIYRETEMVISNLESDSRCPTSRWLLKDVASWFSGRDAIGRLHPEPGDNSPIHSPPSLRSGT